MCTKYPVSYFFLVILVDCPLCPICCILFDGLISQYCCPSRCFIFPLPLSSSKLFHAFYNCNSLHYCFMHGCQAKHTKIARSVCVESNHLTKVLGPLHIPVWYVSVMIRGLVVVSSYFPLNTAEQAQMLMLDANVEATWVTWEQIFDVMRCR